MKWRGVDRHADSQERTERGGCKPPWQAGGSSCTGSRRNYRGREQKPSSSRRELRSVHGVPQHCEVDRRAADSQNREALNFCRAGKAGRHFILPAQPVQSTPRWVVDMRGRMSVEAHVKRRTSGSVVAEQEGHGGGHRGQVGDKQSISQTDPRSWTFWGWPNVNNANPRSKKPEGRKKRYPKGRTSLSNGIDWRHRFRGLAVNERRRGTATSYRFFLPSGQSGHRNALSTRKRVSPGQRAQVVCFTPYAPVQTAPLRAERQAGYQTKQHQGLVVGRAVGPARGMPKGMGDVCEK